ncbi:hypothetical protein QBC39DRAFT_349281 [Podospora conica]|nr:hypothetical protein QBC39DRAFT_349281 [Schizothecium conicum]
MPPLNAPQAQGDEDRLEDQLEHLKELHLQLRRLRTVIPRMLAPMAAPQPSPRELHKTFSKSVEEAQKEIASFQNAYTSDTTKAILQEAASSRQANPLGIAVWNPCADPDWATLKPRQQKPSAS